MTHAHRGWFLAGAACLASAAPAVAAEPVNGLIAYTILSAPTAIVSTDPLRTGTYTATLTFTLATTEP